MNDMNRRITRTIQSSFGNVVCLQECPIWRKISLGIDKVNLLPYNFVIFLKF
jgi:hypothetical protein